MGVVDGGRVQSCGPQLSQAGGCVLDVSFLDHPRSKEPLRREEPMLQGDAHPGARAVQGTRAGLAAPAQQELISCF